MGYKIKNVYIWDKLVWGESWGGGWRQPGENTLGYWPLTSTSTYSDLSGNNNTLTTNWWTHTFGTFYGVDCVELTRSASLQNVSMSTGFPLGNNARTFSCWMYMPNNAPGETNIFWTWSNSYHKGFQLYASGDQFAVRTYYDDAWGATPLIGQWVNFIGTYNGSGSVLGYLNWVPSMISNITLDTDSTTVAMWSYFVDWWIDGCLSECIVESACWTAQEVEDYFNATKAKYWVS